MFQGVQNRERFACEEGKKLRNVERVSGYILSSLFSTFLTLLSRAPFINKRNTLLFPHCHIDLKEKVAKESEFAMSNIDFLLDDIKSLTETTTLVNTQFREEFINYYEEETTKTITSSRYAPYL